VDVQLTEGLSHNLGYQYDRTLGWFPMPSSRKTFTGLRTVSVAHNSKGFRDPEPVFDDRPRIVFIGDSFTWGYDVEAEKCFTEKLRTKHSEWQIYNFGVCGYSTDQEYLLLQRHFREYQPNVVFLVFCTENDDGGNCSNTGGGIYFKPYYTVGPAGLKLKGVPVPGSDKVFCLSHPWLSKSYLLRLIVRAYNNLIDPQPKFSHCPTTAIVDALDKYVRGNGAVFAVGLTDDQPELEQFLGNSKIPYINLKTDLRYGPGDHWNAEGHGFVCEKIEQFLVSGEYLKQKKRDKSGP
jgi:hypothetical protein